MSIIEYIPMLDKWKLAGSTWWDELTRNLNTRSQDGSLPTPSYLRRVVIAARLQKVYVYNMCVDGK